MVRKTVQVAVRTRPTASFAHDSLKIDAASGSVGVHVAKAAGQVVNNANEDWTFAFDKVLHNSSQEEVYDSCARDIVESVTQGYNGTILAYGQTGAGKTFTMCGGKQSYKYRGVIPRAIGQIFAHVDAHPENEFAVRVSYLEVYNETFYDLLREGGDGAAPDLAVRDDERGSVFIKGLTQALVASEEEALNRLFLGETNRAVAEHNMNKNSTRSHCVFTLHLESRSRVESSERVVVSKLNLVDLAGSERVGKTGTSGALLNEAKYINRSLTFLEQVVVALSDKGREHVPFRQSKLTNMLRDSLGGNCIARLIANVWAEREHLEETVSTLKFASRMMRVSNDATVNVKLDPALLLRKLERQVRELRQELAMHDNLAGRGAVQYDDYTPEQQAELRESLERYVAGGEDEPAADSVCQVRETYRQFRAMVLDARAPGEAAAAAARAAASASAEAASPAAAADAGGEASGEASAAAAAGGANANFVGELDEGDAGNTLGIAPRDARPPSAAASAAADEELAERHEPEQKQEPPKQASRARAQPQTEAEAFAEFRSRGTGAELAAAYDDNRAQLRDARARVRDAGASVNAFKREIDELTARIAEKREAAPPAEVQEGGVEVIDEEEYDLIRRVKAAKASYKSHFEVWRMAKSEATYLRGLVDRAKRALAEAFVEARAEGAERQQAAQEQEQEESADGAAADEDLDDGERFEQLEVQRVMEEDPASLSFYNARKNNKGRRPGAARQLQQQQRGRKAAFS